MEYTESFRSSMVRKMSGRRARSATSLAKETGIPQPTLSRWLRDAGSVRGVAPGESKEPPSRRPQDWPLEDVLEAVLEASRLSGEELGAYLRGQGIHQAHLDQWRERLAAGLKGGASRSKGRRSSDARRVQELEREVRRKDKALAEAAALLMLQKNHPRAASHSHLSDQKLRLPSTRLGPGGAAANFLETEIPEKNMVEGLQRTCEW